MTCSQHVDPHYGGISLMTINKGCEGSSNQGNDDTMARSPDLYMHSYLCLRSTSLTIFLK